MFASEVTSKLEVPGEIGQWVEIKKLGWKKLREAVEVASEGAMRAMRALGKDGLEAVRGVTADQIAEQQKAAADDPASAFDPTTLLRAGVKAWSYERKLTPEALDDLDPAMASWLVREIAVLSQPPKDVSAEKNG